MNNRTIILFTSSFPYGYGEQFIETELKFLAGSFTKICIFPYHYGGTMEKRQGLPENVFVYKPFRDESHNLLKLFLKGILNTRVFLPYWNDLLKHPSLLFDWRKLSLWFRSMLNCRMILGDNRLQECISKYHSGLIFYFYWGHRPSGIICGLKRFKRPIVVRFHGTDLYKEMEINRNYIPFREIVLKNTSHAVFISDNGESYIRKNYSCLPAQIQVHRLGTIDNSTFAWQPSEKLRLISCSTVDENKRIAFIANAISKLNFPVQWTHIGDGPVMQDLRKHCQAFQNGNISIILLGRMTNHQVHRIYQTEQFDLFINISKSEGIPFSIMEALSYSIPVLATAVGGTSEIIDQSCGHLLSIDFSIDKLANCIIDFHSLASERKRTMRMNARSRWELMCSANKNYLKFASFMESL